MKKLNFFTQPFEAQLTRTGFNRITATDPFGNLFDNEEKEENFESTFTVVFKLTKKKIKSYVKTNTKPKIGRTTWFSRYWRKHKNAFITLIMNNIQFKKKVEKFHWYEETKDLLKKKIYNIIRNKVRKMKKKYGNYPENGSETQKVEWFKKILLKF